MSVDAVPHVELLGDDVSQQRLQLLIERAHRLRR